MSESGNASTSSPPSPSARRANATTVSLAPSMNEAEEDRVEAKYAINLDEVSHHLQLPVETISQQLQWSDSCTRDNFDQPEQQQSSKERTSMLSHSVRASALHDSPKDAPLDPLAVDRSREVSFVTHTYHRRDSSAVVRVEGSICNTGGTPSSPQQGSPCRAPRSSTFERTPLVNPPAGSPGKSRSKRVHFPDNVVESVCIIPSVDGRHHELRVKYNRPWYAYVLFFASNVFFVFAWTEIMKAAWPSSWPDESLTAAVSIVAFIAFAFSSVFLLFYLLLTWRPLEHERQTLRSRWFARSFIKTMLYGTAAQTMLMISCMLHITCVNTITFTTVPLVVTFLYEKVQHKAVTSLDTFGTVASTIGLVVLCVGEERADVGDRMHRFGAIVAGLFAGICMAPYLSQLRMVSKDVSNAFVITMSVLCVTAIAAGIAGIAGGFTTPLGNGDDRTSVFSDLSNQELLRVMLSGAFMFFFWLLHHKVSLYFDRMSIVAGYSLCAPIVLVIYHLQDLPTMDHVFEGIGGAMVTLGCSTVVFSGWYYRMNVAIRIETD